MKRLILIAIFTIAAASPAPAQTIDYAQRAADLEGLSRVFGELHHIRRMCEPRREAEVWRDRMRRLVELEQPTQALRDRMVLAFNTGFKNAEQRFRYCDRDARDYAASRATQGDQMTARLMAPLYDALAESGDLPTVWRGTEGEQ